MKLSPQERKDLDKYTKFLALKSAQIIVQSRISEKSHTVCRPETAGKDWVRNQFNLNVADIPEVLYETKRVLCSELFSTCVPLCVEILLRTADGDQMVLETWSLSLLPEQYDGDSSVRMINLIYNKMGTLLKSLVSVTRVLPAYKLSRRQGSDCFILFYRLYMSEPELHKLGDDSKQLRIGQICTPIGTIQLAVSYRTKFAISPTQINQNNNASMMMVKSDHFNVNSLNTRKSTHDDIHDMSKPMSPGPFADPLDGNQMPMAAPPMDAGVHRLLVMARSKQRRCLAGQKNSENDEEVDGIHTSEDEDSSERLIQCSTMQNNGHPLKKKASPAPEEEDIVSDDDSTIHLSEDDVIVNHGNDSHHQTNGITTVNDCPKNKMEKDNNVNIKQPVETEESNKTANDSCLKQSSSSTSSMSTNSTPSPKSPALLTSSFRQPGADQDLQEMRTQLYAPFASTNPLNELMNFVRQCKDRPPLQAPHKSPTVDEITKLLESCELKAPEYDELIKSLCNSPEYSFF